jgi:hypothetical protein
MSREIFNYSTLIQKAPEPEKDGVVRQFFFDADRTLTSRGFKRDGVPSFSGRGFKITYLDEAGAAAHLTFDGTSSLSVFFRGKAKSWNKPVLFDNEVGAWIDSINMSL